MLINQYAFSEKCVWPVEKGCLIVPSLNFLQTEVFDIFFGLVSTNKSWVWQLIHNTIDKYTYTFKQEDEGNN